MLIRVQHRFPIARNLGRKDSLRHGIDIRPVDARPLGEVVMAGVEVIAEPDHIQPPRDREPRLLRNLTDRRLLIALTGLWRTGDALPKAAALLGALQEKVL